MTDARTDEIAREAARLIHTGRAANVPDAIRRAADMLGHAHVPFPGPGRVRKHAQAMSMQELGSGAYRDLQLKVLNIAEQMMTAIEHAMPDVQTLFVGRAAEAHIDAGVTIHIRLYTREPIERVAQALTDFGYDDPTFTTIDTRRGRMNQVRFEEDGFEIALTRCMPEFIAESQLDLVTGRPIVTRSHAALQQMISNWQRATPQDSED